MFIYMTSGTPEFMEKVRSKYSAEKMVVLHGGGNSLLLHETPNKTVFQTPKKFEVMDTNGDISEQGYFVLNHVSVTDEGVSVLEHDFTKLASTLGNEPGLVAYRFLRPYKSDTYIVLTEWIGPHAYEVWKQSRAYETIQHVLEAPKQKLPHMFSSAPYVSTYTAKPKKEPSEN